MALKVTGVKATQRRLENIGARSSEAARRELERGAKAIAKTASEFAPRDTGALENAIEAVPVKGGGINRRTVWIVRIKPGARRRKRYGNGRIRVTRVTRYATRMETGFYKLRKRSLEKQASLGRSGFVGRHYIRRAVQEHQAEITKRISQAIGRAIK